MYIDSRLNTYSHLTKDWSFWGSGLGLEGKTIIAFLTACHGYLGASTVCLRCKMLLREGPDAIVHENVLSFPVSLLSDVLGYLA